MAESIDDMQARHRRELRELQGRITSKKKNATKKTRKGVNDECAGMENDVRAKHQAELAAAAGGRDSEEAPDRPDESEADGADKLADKLADTSIARHEPETAQTAQTARTSQTSIDTGSTADTAATADTEDTAEAAPQKKRNRQKERLARRAAEQEAAAAAAADEASHMVDHAAVERASMKPLIAKSGRIEYPIRPDGHCLFSSVADQLALLGKTVTSDADGGVPAFRKVRHVAAEYMEAHGDDFAPFLLAYSGDDDAPDLATHIAQIRDTAEWGGQMELVALANAYGVNIRVLHDGRSELIEPSGAHGTGGADKDSDGDEADGRPTLWLVYYRHGFGLGEHYNSLRAKST
ncbi:otu domain-containing protein 6b [Ophiostoma piceae UAMH 11346]|uniref:Otu domain-containing protein 6b n=1 Tax=Ophiostoma piceae (strain UAMH 11346) TaxID=1262450 RepID=S3CW01_OPHP1|nr:otu domain-containing protein 6b [Ophiostoma piceae UAMH 11346]